MRPTQPSSLCAYSSCCHQSRLTWVHQYQRKDLTRWCGDRQNSLATQHYVRYYVGYNNVLRLFAALKEFMIKLRETDTHEEIKT